MNVKTAIINSNAQMNNPVLNVYFCLELEETYGRKRNEPKNI